MGAYEKQQTAAREQFEHETDLVGQLPADFFPLLLGDQLGRDFFNRLDDPR